MKRNIYKFLVKWKNQQDHMPLILMGARQVGKTYIVNEFGGREYPDVHFFNFQENPDLSNIFEKDFDTGRILEELSIFQEKSINIDADLVFFDEIQECEKAITSLKYFHEKVPQLDIICAGSLLGIKLNAASFPVGKVEMMFLYPMTFEEFIEASENDTAKKVFSETNRLESAHNILWKFCREYFFVGGMPKAVRTWFSDDEINERIGKVRKIQKDIITGYEKDFSKHSGKINAIHISDVLNNVPRQLSSVLDDSVKRFRFKDVIASKRTYQDLYGPINWLENAGLLYKTYIVEGKHSIPLKSFVKDNIFKLFLFDVGLLGAMLDLTYKDCIDHNYGITKGFFAENFVACELKSSGIDTLFSWSERSAEIEFLLVSKDSKVIPVEVKSGKRTQAKSLKSYSERYSPEKTVKLVGKVGGTDSETIVLPLYYVTKLREII